MFEGHRLVCYERATADDVRRARVVFALFKTARRQADGWDFATLLLPRLGLEPSIFAGKVLVHLDDEYGARRPKSEAEVEPKWRMYCDMYAGWKRVFRNYWSAGWAERVGRNHAMNCSCGAAAGRAAGGGSAGRGGGSSRHGLEPTPAADPRVEWVPLGWSSNWQPRAAADDGALRRSSARGTAIGFYGNEKSRRRTLLLFPRGFVHLDPATAGTSQVPAQAEPSASDREV